MKRLLWITICIVSGWGFEVMLEPEEIEQGETATLVISHTEPLKNFSLPEVEGLRLQYQGVSQFTSVQVINGKMTTSKNFHYTYIIIPTKEGKFTIPSFEVQDKKKQVYRTPPLVLNVVKQRQTRPSPSSTVGEYILPRLWYELIPNKTFVFQNEALILTGFLVSDQKEALFYPFQEIRPLVANNCLFYDGSRFLSGKVKVERKSGYWRRPIHQWILFGVEPGLLAIAPPQMIAISPLGQISVPTENIAIDVRRAPTFLYRGNLEIEVAPLPTVITQGTSIEYKIILRGDGNLAIFSDLLYGISLSNVSVSPVKIQHTLTNWRDDPEFVQTLSYQMSFLKEGTYEIPKREVVYLDKRGIKRRASFSARRIEVVGKRDDREVFPLLVHRKKNEIRYVGRSWLFWFLMIGVIVSPWGAIFWQRHQRRMTEDTKYSNFIRSLTQIRSYFSGVEEALKSKDTRRSAQELCRSFWYFLVDREQLPRHLDKKTLLQELSQKGWNEEERKEIAGIFQHLERIAYAPGVSTSQMQQIYEKVQKLIKEHYRVL